MFNNKKDVIVIIFPNFNDEKNVGRFRILRFINWLHSLNYYVVVVSNGIDKKVKYNWGINFQIRSKSYDSLFKIIIKMKQMPILKYVGKFIHLILKVFLIPDELILWSNKITKDKELIRIIKSSKLIIASSPIESSHVASLKFSKKYKIPFIVDLRDGWLDEPLKLDIILKIKPRMILESKLEKEVYQYSSGIFVTSYNWKKLLIERIPEIKTKVKILTNCFQNYDYDINKKNSEINLVYAGGLKSSRKSVDVSLLYEPFIKYKLNDKVNIHYYGKYKESEKAKINGITETINLLESYVNDFVRIEELRNIISISSGLLLLSVSLNSIPAKFYEYIISKKPVLVIAYKESCVKNYAESISQFYCYELDGDEKRNEQIFIEFLNACKTGNYKYEIPERFSEAYGKKIFANEIKSILNG